MVTQTEVKAFLAAAQTDERLNSLWKAMQKRVAVNSQCPSLLQPGDTNEWWHIVEERLTELSFVYMVTKTPEAGRFLHDRVIEICTLSDDEWIGPWFRGRKEPLVGQLETAHVSVAVATALALCGDLFTDEEMPVIREALYEKGLIPCERYLDERRNDANNNWYMILLDGFGTAGAVLGDERVMQKAVELFSYCTGLYNKDSYGESLQYWNYASLKLGHLYEVMLRYKPKIVQGLDLPYVHCVPWAVSSLLYVNPTDNELPPTLCINYGDSAATYRISGDLAMHIARRAGAENAKEAGLARWLFEVGYGNANLCSDGSSTFGFVNDYGFYTLLNYTEAAAPLSPTEAGLPLCSSYDVGHVIMRDGFGGGSAVVSVQGGYEPLKTASHRHMDQNSFTLTHNRERFFVDPGHCCYRLKTQAFSISAKSHNTWRFITPDGGIIEQRLIDKTNCDVPLNKLLMTESRNGVCVTASDAALAYGAPIRKAERVIVTVLPDAVFIIDTIEADAPVKVEANFVTNNLNNKLKYNIASSDRLVLRRNEAALKLFLGEAEPSCKFSFSWGYVHDAYHPQPNQPVQGREGSAVIFTQTSAEFATHHRMVYVVAMSPEKDIKGWHIYNRGEGVFEVEAPKAEYCVRLKVGDGELVVDTKDEVGISWRCFK